MYASIDDFGDVTVTEDQIRRASLAVDRALIGALYATDDQGMPTDPDVVEALRDATVAQTRAIASTETGGPALKSATIGRASYTYVDATPGGLTLPAGGRLCPDATTILQLASLVPAGVEVRG
jgi:hypothetical protein